MSILDEVKMFEYLSASARQGLLAQARSRIFEKGQLIVPRNTKLKFVYFVISGRVVESAYTRSGKQVIYHTMSAGDCFGLQSISGDILASADILATTSCEICAIRAQTFSALMNQNERLRDAVFKAFSDAIVRLSGRLYTMRAMDVSQRTRAEILKYASPCSIINDNSLVFLIGLPTHEEIANAIFSHREAVTKEICILRKKGIIQAFGDRVLMANIKLLRASVDAV